MVDLAHLPTDLLPCSREVRSRVRGGVAPARVPPGRSRLPGPSLASEVVDLPLGEHAGPKVVTAHLGYRHLRPQPGLRLPPEDLAVVLRHARPAPRRGAACRQSDDALAPRTGPLVVVLATLTSPARAVSRLSKGSRP